MAAMNRRSASERMRLRNPMQRQDVRSKVSNTLRAMGWKPPVRGGNGRGLTVPQALLGSVFDLETEVAVKTRIPRGNGFPPCYKLDLADRDLRIGIEVDGVSHCSIQRQEQDVKKQDFLQSIGWTVLRFTNRQVMEHLGECVQTVVSTIWKSTPTTTTSQTDF
jgi:hypothetical protein